MFTETPNAYDVRIECNYCHESKSGSLARAWAASHDCDVDPIDLADEAYGNMTPGY